MTVRNGTLATPGRPMRSAFYEDHTELTTAGSTANFATLQLITNKRSSASSHRCSHPLSTKRSTCAWAPALIRPLFPASPHQGVTSTVVSAKLRSPSFTSRCSKVKARSVGSIEHPAVGGAKPQARGLLVLFQMSKRGRARNGQHHGRSRQ